MWPVSDRFLDGVANSHEVVSRVEVWRDGAEVLHDLPVTGGSVEIAEDSKVRRTLKIDTSEIALDPQDAEDLLSPFGTELHVYTGLRLPEGDVEEVPVGVFGIQNAGRAGWLSALGLDADDRSRTIARNRFLTPFTTTAGTTVLATVTSLVTATLPDVEVYDLTEDGIATLRTVGTATYERERWDAIEDLMDGIGCEAVFDPEGRLVIREVLQTPADAEPSWTIHADADDAVLVDFATALSADGFYNAVVATSSDPDAPTVTAIAYQTTGPLRWRAGLQRPRFYASPLLRSQEAAAEAAKSLLARSVAIAQGLSITALPNPALDVGDVVTITLPDAEPENRIVSKISLPLTPGPMQIETRSGIDAETTDDAEGI